MHTHTFSPSFPNLTSARLVAAAFLAAPTLATADHVDFLVDAPFSSSSSLGDVGEVAGAPSNILGAFRAFETINNEATGDVSASLLAGGPLSLVDSGGARGTYNFGYGSHSLSGSNLAANFIGGPGWNSISLTFDNVGGSGVLDLVIDSGPNSYNWQSLNVTGPGEYVFFHSDATDAIPGFDFTAVDGISVELTSLQPDSAFEISNFHRSFVPIPEPTAALLAGLSIIPFLFMRRRR